MDDKRPQIIRELEGKTIDWVTCWDLLRDNTFLRIRMRFTDGKTIEFNAVPFGDTEVIEIDDLGITEKESTDA